YDFIDRFISDMESSTDISLAGWLHPNLNKTFYSLLEQIGYAGWSYYFDSPDSRNIFSVQAELKDEDKEPTFYDTYRIVSITDSLPGFFIDGGNPADFFDLTKYFTCLTALDKSIMQEPFKKNIDALIFQFSYPKEKYFTQGDIFDLYELHFECSIFDIEKLRTLKYFIDQELTFLRSKQIISKKQKKKAKDPDSFHLIAPNKLFSRINDNISAVSSESTSSQVLQFLESQDHS
ncbi:MAG: hypothetical protein KAJ56_00320, partial [Candidatus Aenigmarchaeota archaeon]|nr:hypothetical protein [Candidatus Aenigmarchaeota archaeon]